MLTIDEFRLQMTNLLPLDTVMENPGRGNTTIKGYSSRNVRYIRGKSTFRVSILNLYSAYVNFRGKLVSSRDLKDFAPAIFDSSARPAGHSCNCTFLFMTLTRLGLADGIHGEGKARQPFYSTFL